MNSSNIFFAEAAPLVSAARNFPVYDMENQHSSFEEVVVPETDSTDETKSENDLDEPEGSTSLLEEVRHALTDVAQVAEELTENIQSSIAEDLQGLEDGEFFFLEMGLTRNLSLLPSDVIPACNGLPPENFLQAVVPAAGLVDSASVADTETITSTTFVDSERAESSYLEGSIEGEECDTDVKVDSVDMLTKDNNEDTNADSSSTPLIAYLLLTAVVLGLSLQGPILGVQQGVDSTMKIAWRNIATVFILLPLAVRSLVLDGAPPLTADLWLILILTAGCLAGCYVLFSWALDYTSVGNVVILSNSQALILLVGKIFIGEPISLSEGAGATVAFLGAFICARDSSSPSSNDAGGRSYRGELYAIGSAILGIFYMVGAKKIRRVHMDLSVFMFLVMLISALESLLYLMVSGVPFSIDADVNAGVFGWMTPRFDRLPTEVLAVLVCNVMGSMGFVLCMKYFSNLTLSVAILMEPAVADFLAVILGVGDMPGLAGWVGNALVVLGTLCVVRQPNSTTEKK